MSSENIRPNQLRQDALDGRLAFDQARNRIIGRDDTGLARLIVVADGNQFRMKVSQVGLDVLTASEDELVFDSNNNLFKIVDKGTINVTFPAVGPGTSGQFSEQSNQYTVNHDLGTPPVTIAYIDSEDQKSGERTLHSATFTQHYSLTNTAAIWRTGQIYTTDNTLVYSTTSMLFGMTASGNPVPAFDTVMRWYILRETADVL